MVVKGLLVCSRLNPEGPAAQYLANYLPQQGAVTVGGKVGATGVDSQILLLRSGLEVFQWQIPPGSQVTPSGLVVVGPHIGGVYINEETTTNVRYCTCSPSPGLPELSWQPWETPPASISSTSVVQGCRCGVAGL